MYQKKPAVTVAALSVVVSNQTTTQAGTGIGISFVNDTDMSWIAISEFGIVMELSV